MSLQLQGAYWLITYVGNIMLTLPGNLQVVGLSDAISKIPLELLVGKVLGL